MKSVAWLLVASLVVTGCSKPEGAKSEEQPAANVNNSATTNYENLRAGLTLLEGSTDSVQSALNQATTERDQATAEMREALDDIVAMLDSAGATLQEAAIELPNAKDVNRQEFKYKALRTAMLEAAQDAYLELRDAAGAARSIAESKPSLDDLANLIDLAVEDTAETVRELGGVIPTEPEQPS